MKSKQITRISILQSSKIVTAMYVILGCVYALIGIPMVVFGGGALRGMGVIYILMPIVMAVVGFFGFVIFAWIYNLLAEWLGGFEIETRDIGAVS